MSDANEKALNYFNISCPRGGRRYICGGLETEFIGCCNVDPCANSGICPDDALRYTSFNKTLYDELPKQACDVGGKPADKWYTCAFTAPAFMGCCNVNPCPLDKGCPENELLPAVLTTSDTNRNDFLDPPNADSSSATATASSNPDGGYSLSTGAIVGIAVGGVVVLGFLLGLLIWRLWLVPRKRKRAEEAEKDRNGQQHQQQSNMNHPTPPAPGYPQTPMSQHQSSFGTSPSPAYPSGVSTDAYGNKLSPYPSDRPVSTNFSDVSSVYGRPPYNQGYSPVPMVPVQEMEGAPAAPPQELSTGQEHGIPLDRPQSTPQSLQSPNQNRNQNHLGISS